MCVKFCQYQIAKNILRQRLYYYICIYTRAGEKAIFEKNYIKK